MCITPLCIFRSKYFVDNKRRITYCIRYSKIVLFYFKIYYNFHVRASILANLYFISLYSIYLLYNCTDGHNLLLIHNHFIQYKMKLQLYNIVFEI